MGVVGGKKLTRLRRSKSKLGHNTMKAFNGRRTIFYLNRLTSRRRVLLGRFIVRLSNSFFVMKHNGISRHEF